MPVPKASFTHNGKFIPTVPTHISPGAEDYFAIRLENWLEGSSLASVSWVISPSNGITKFYEALDTDDPTIAIVGINGFQAGLDYTVTCTHESDDAPPRIDSHSMIIQCRQK